MTDTQIVPNPQYPSGGHAMLQGTGLPAGRVSLSIKRRLDERYLGNDGWQSAPTHLGPMSIDEHGNIPMGPEVVDHMEVYTALQITISGEDFYLEWPDNILGSPALAGLGGIGITKPMTTTEKEPVLQAKEPLMTPDPEPEAEPEPEPISELAPEPPAKKAPPLGLILGAILLTLAIAAAVYFLVLPETTQKNADKPKAQSNPTAETRLTCDSDQSRIMGAEFADQLTLLQSCSGTFDENLAMGIAEKGLASGNPDILLAMAHYYDGKMGLLGHMADPADLGIALRYYVQANDAGNKVAAENLKDACNRVDQANPLQAAAGKKYCPEN